MGARGGGVGGSAAGSAQGRGRARRARLEFEPAGRMSRFLNVLRSWLVMVSVIAAGNTLQSFRDHGFLSEKLYTASPGLGKGCAGRPGAWRCPFSHGPCTVFGVPPLGSGDTGGGRQGRAWSPCAPSFFTQ